MFCSRHLHYLITDTITCLSVSLHMQIIARFAAPYRNSYMGTRLQTDSRELHDGFVGVCAAAPGSAFHPLSLAPRALTHRMALHSSKGMESNSIARASGDGEQHA